MPQNERDDPARGGGRDRYVIHIDKQQYVIEQPTITGAELRQLASIAVDRDLLQKVPGGQDVPIADDTVVTLKDGLHFFTTPRDVTPGSVDGQPV